MKCGFGIGYGIGRNKYQPTWVSVSVLDRNQNSGFGRTLQRGFFVHKCIGGVTNLIDCNVYSNSDAFDECWFLSSGNYTFLAKM